MKQVDRFSKRLRSLRRLKGVTQLQLAASTYISQGTISRLEKGITLPNEYQKRALAEKLEVKPSLLFGEYSRRNEEDAELRRIENRIEEETEKLRDLEESYLRQLNKHRIEQPELELNFN